MLCLHARDCSNPRNKVLKLKKTNIYHHDLYSPPLQLPYLVHQTNVQLILNKTLSIEAHYKNINILSFFIRFLSLPSLFFSRGFLSFFIHNKLRFNYLIPFPKRTQSIINNVIWVQSLNIKIKYECI